MKRILLLSLALLLAACSTTTPPPAPPAPAPAEAPASAPPPPPPPAKAEPMAPMESPAQMFERQRAALATKSVYFDFDGYAVKPEYEQVVTAHANLANTYAQDHVTLQGNCDERGGREYNLALGQHRAEAVKKRLVLLGVPAARIDTVSLGKEKPRSLCHEESCWSENRRADFIDTWK